MNRRDAIIFVKAMSGVNVHIAEYSNWINFPCPLSRWTHDKGTDNTPSFGISLDDVSSRYRCFTCGHTGDLKGLVNKLERLNKKSYPKLQEYVEAEEIGGLVQDWGEEGADSDPLKFISNDDVYYYDVAGGNEYLESRGIDKETSLKLGLRVDYEEDTKDNRERILFPVYSLDNGEAKLIGYSGRATDDKKELKVKDYRGLKKKRGLLGVERIKPEHEFVVVSEGLMDYAINVKHGLPAVAVMGSNLSKEQAKMLVELDRPIYVMMDNDKPGRKGEDQIIKKLEGYLPLYLMDYPERFIFGEGDPAILTQDEVNLMIEKARLI